MEESRKERVMKNLEDYLEKENKRRPLKIISRILFWISVAMFFASILRLLNEENLKLFFIRLLLSLIIFLFSTVVNFLRNPKENWKEFKNLFCV